MWAGGRLRCRGGGADGQKAVSGERGAYRGTIPLHYQAALQYSCEQSPMCTRLAATLLRCRCLWMCRALPPTCPSFMSRSYRRAWSGCCTFGAYGEGHDAAAGCTWVRGG